MKRVVLDHCFKVLFGSEIFPIELWSYSVALLEGAAKNIGAAVAAGIGDFFDRPDLVYQKLATVVQSQGRYECGGRLSFRLFELADRSSEDSCWIARRESRR